MKPILIAALLTTAWATPSPGPFDHPMPMCRYDARGLETPLPHKPFSCIPSPPPLPSPQPTK